jgi:hypothetical protein
VHGSTPRQNTKNLKGDDGKMKANQPQKIKDVCHRMYLYFTSYEDRGAPSFGKFARSIGISHGELMKLRGHKRFDAAYRECCEIRRDFLIDRALDKRFDPSYKKLTASLTSLIPSTVCMVFTVSVILTAKDNLTASAVIDGLVKLACLPIIGFKGTLDGYRFTREDKSAWLDTKARLLEAYLNSKCS